MRNTGSIFNRGQGVGSQALLTGFSKTSGLYASTIVILSALLCLLFKREDWLSAMRLIIGGSESNRGAGQQPAPRWWLKTCGPSASVPGQGGDRTRPSVATVDAERP